MEKSYLWSVPAAVLTNESCRELFPPSGTAEARDEPVPLQCCCCFLVLLWRKGLVPSPRLSTAWARGAAASQDGFVLQTDDMEGLSSQTHGNIHLLYPLTPPRVPGIPPTLTPNTPGPQAHPLHPSICCHSRPCSWALCHSEMALTQLEWQCHE